MNKQEEFFFKTKKDAVSYIFTKLQNPTPIKLQKALYFVWAFYSATYGNVEVDESENSGSDILYPNYLFKSDFEAWQYGPVDQEVWEQNKNGDIKTIDKPIISLVTITNEPNIVYDITSFIDDMINQVNTVNDFGLVNRSHQDSAWRNVFRPGEKHIKMDKEAIKRDYVEYVQEQSKI